MIHLRAIALAALAALASACSSSSDASEPPPDASAPSEDAAVVPDAGTGADAGEDAPADAGCTGLWVDEAGVTQGCGAGGMGIGDHDDGGGAAPAPPTVPMDASDLPFASSCWNNAQCESNLCFDYVVKGQFCSLRCETDSDCPPPALGCNGMGVCRVGG